MVNVYDLENAYAKALRSHMEQMGMQSIILHLGRKAGDLLKVPLQALECPVDFLVSGPPCPPWAGNGCKKGLKDARAKVFLRVLEWVVFLICNGGLLGVILENVTGIMTWRDGRESTMEKIFVF